MPKKRDYLLMGADKGKYVNSSTNTMTHSSYPTAGSRTAMPGKSRSECMQSVQRKFINPILARAKMKKKEEGAYTPLHRGTYQTIH